MASVLAVEMPRLALNCAAAAFAAAAPLVPLPAPALAPSLSAPSIRMPAATPSSALPAAPLAAALPLVERRGRDEFGREVIVLDALDPAAPGRGTVGHIDFSVGRGQAQLDGPLDFYTPGRPDGVPTEADLTHFREHLWFGLAVLPGYRDAGLGARLMDAAVAHMRTAGARVLFIRATPSSLGFYRARFGAAVRSVEEERGDDGEVLYRVEVDLSAR
jgi:GNAT superfamily N-acetyltransferase